MNRADESKPGSDGVSPPLDRSGVPLVEATFFVAFVYVVECVVLAFVGSSNPVLFGSCCGGLAAGLFLAGTLCLLSRPDPPGTAKRVRLFSRVGVSDRLSVLWVSASILAVIAAGFRPDAMFFLWQGCVGAIGVGAVRCFTGAKLAFVDSHPLQATGTAQQTEIRQMFFATTAIAIAALVTKWLLGNVRSEEVSALFFWTSFQVCQMILIAVILLRTHISLVLLLLFSWIGIQVYGSFFFTEFREGGVTHPDTIAWFNVSVLGHCLMYFALLRSRGCRWMLRVKRSLPTKAAE